MSKPKKAELRSIYTRQAIQTKYCGPTNTKGARILAKAEAGTMYVSWDYALDIYENHAQAARQFAKKWDWTGRLQGGALPDGTHCFVFIEGSDSK